MYLQIRNYLALGKYLGMRKIYPEMQKYLGIQKYPELRKYLYLNTLIREIKFIETIQISQDKKKMGMAPMGHRSYVIVLRTSQYRLCQEPITRVMGS